MFSSLGENVKAAIENISASSAGIVASPLASARQPPGGQRRYQPAWRRHHRRPGVAMASFSNDKWRVNK